MSQGEVFTELLHFRRSVSDMYAAVRHSSQPAVDCWKTWRATRDAIFAHHPQSALTVAQKATFAGLAYFPYDPAWRFVTAVDPNVEPTVIAIETAHDGTIRAQRFGKVDLAVTESVVTLSLFWLLGYGGGLFLPFRDATNGDTTYGGGRYLLDTIKHADLGQTPDGRLILDFNYAYNPSCAYNHQWSCPLAPPENRLSIPVTVGERHAALAE